jgi:hypothetical protein
LESDRSIPHTWPSACRTWPGSNRASGKARRSANQPPAP